MTIEFNRISQAYAEWLSYLDWKYFITLHFKSGVTPHLEEVTKLVKHFSTRLSAYLNGRRSKTKLSIFPVYETSKSDISHVHIMIGPENNRSRGVNEISEAVASIWSKQTRCADPRRLGRLNDGWFKEVEGTKKDLIKYVCKEFKVGKDPVLVDAITINS